MFTKPQNVQHCKKNLDQFIVLFFFSILGSSFYAQENPWNPKKGTNPWGNTEETQQTKNHSTLDSAVVQLSVDSVKTSPAELHVRKTEPIRLEREMDMVYIEKYKSYFYKVNNSNYYAFSSTIKDTIFLSANDGKILILDRQSNETLKRLERYSKVQYEAPSAFIGSFLCSAFLNVFSIPVNLISLAIPSYGRERFVTEYIKENKKATEVEVKSIKKGIINKRAQNTGVGTLCGVIFSSILWFNIFN